MFGRLLAGFGGFQYLNYLLFMTIRSGSVGFYESVLNVLMYLKIEQKSEFHSRETLFSYKMVIISLN
jgi:hypothetical protein